MDDSGPRRLQEIAMGYYSSQALYVAARLGIADLLDGGPMSVEDLAAEAGADPDSLGRILRLLTLSGVFDADAEGRVVQNEASAHLRSAPQGSMKDLVEVFGDEFYAAFGNLLATVRSGRDAFRVTYGRGLFEYLEERPDRARAFDRAMGAGSIFFSALPAVYDFSGVGTLVDVGGGNGALLVAVLQAHPQMRGVLFDSASVIDAAPQNPALQALSGRVDRVAGDFFTSIVPGGDAYLFSRILHDWTDEQCLRILGNCREAINPQGRLLIVERLLPGPYATATDVNMLAVTGGRERSREDFGRLLEATGFRQDRVFQLPLEFSLLEARAQ